jgi:hypothetical protein
MDTAAAGFPDGEALRGAAKAELAATEAALLPPG